MKLFCVGCEKIKSLPDLNELGITGTFKGLCDDCKKVLNNIKSHNREDLFK